MNDIAKIDYFCWAENLLQEIYYAPNEEQRIAVIKEHLLKAAARGYTEGSESGWVHNREKDMQHCHHQFNLENLTCVKCGSTTI